MRICAILLVMVLSVPMVSGCLGGSDGADETVGIDDGAAGTAGDDASTLGEEIRTIDEYRQEAAQSIDASRAEEELRALIQEIESDR